MTLKQLIDDRYTKALWHDDLPTVARLKQTRQRVAFYHRCCLDEFLMSESIQLRIWRYEEWINNIPSWTFFEGFSDECLFCTPLDERPGFCQMRERIEHYDLIVCWSVSSLGSIFPDVINVIKWFEDRKVGFYFEVEDLYSLDDDFALFLQAYTELKEKEKGLEELNLEAIDDGDDSEEKNAIDDCEKLLLSLPDWDLKSLSVQQLQALYYWLYERHYKHVDIYEQKYSMYDDD